MRTVPKRRGLNVWTAWTKYPRDDRRSHRRFEPASNPFAAEARVTDRVLPFEVEDRHESFPGSSALGVSPPVEVQR